MNPKIPLEGVQEALRRIPLISQNIWESRALAALLPKLAVGRGARA